MRPLSSRRRWQNLQWLRTKIDRRPYVAEARTSLSPPDVIAYLDGPSAPIETGIRTFLFATAEQRDRFVETYAAAHGARAVPDGLPDE